MPRGDRSRREASQRGRDAEVEIARRLEKDGYVCGSRRHIGGAGDLLAVRGEPPTEEIHVMDIRLIEVKTTKRCWHKFGRADRIALKETAARIGATPLLAWWPSMQGEVQWLGEESWPTR